MIGNLYRRIQDGCIYEVIGQDEISAKIAAKRPPVSNFCGGRLAAILADIPRMTTRACRKLSVDYFHYVSRNR